MNVRETAAVLAVITVAWPWAELDEHSLDVWADALADLDPETALEAAKRLVRSESRPPSIARLREQAAAVGADRARSASRALPAPDRDTDRRWRARSAARLRAVRAGWDAAQETRPDHNHRRGAAACPRCSTAEQFVADTAAEIAAVILEHR